MVNGIGFVISEEEDLALGPETRLDHSELLCGRSFITVKKDKEKFWQTSERGQREPHSLALSALNTLLPNPLPQPIS